jgi:N-acetylglucosamine PTS system EIIB component
MFEKFHQALWKALTPDLVPDVTRANRRRRWMEQCCIGALGGAGNIKIRTAGGT